MSPSTKPQESALASEDWQLAAEDAPKPISLVVQRRREVLVLPWFRFVYAAGDNTQVEIVFATHVVNVEGFELAALLAAVSFQNVIRLIEPSEKEARFGVRGAHGNKQMGPGIQSIAVSKVEQGG